MATIRIEHPLGLEPPPEWDGLDAIPVAELARWLSSGPKMEEKKPGPRGGKRVAHGRYREDLGRYMRSTMEANWCRFLKWSGYQEWKGKDDPPPGKWYRYEGRVWDFPQKTRNGKYKSDFEVWPGLVDPSRPYEVHEVKGWLDGDSKVRLKRMGKYYPDVPVELINQQVFRHYTKGLEKIIPNWGA